MISREDILKIANLSKLNLTEEEIVKYQSELNDIFDHINKLGELDVENIEPLYSTINVSNNLRKDEIEVGLDKKDFLRNSPDKDEDFIVVPKIIE